MKWLISDSPSSNPHFYPKKFGGLQIIMYFCTNFELCNSLVTLRLHTCLMYYADVIDEDQLPSVDYAEAFADYLLTHGMTQQQLDALVEALTGKTPN